MNTSFVNFMTNLIDYAGLFPPAGLDIETVLGNYAGYLEGKNGWMLGGCIVPVRQLHRVALHAGFRCSVIVSPGLPQDELDQLSSFTGSSSFTSSITMVETRLSEIANFPNRCLNHLLHLQTRLTQAGLQDVQLFVEADNVAPIASQIASFNLSNSGGGGWIKKVGYKLRCGGLIKKDFPAPEKVADTIRICCEHEIPIKFTAGMHQPLRNHSTELNVMQHGFINILGATLLYWSGNLSKSEILECLLDKNSQDFRFTEEKFSWKDKSILATEINQLRKSSVKSFGSCSFAEPVEGLNLLEFSE
jgi:hypothetical protein